MKYQKFLYFIQNVGRDPSALIFEDYLTGLNNRRFILHYLKHNIDWNSLDERPVSLLMVDIDYFKRINEQYGHAIGDQVLIHIAGILKSISKEKAIPSLYAGDIFMLLLPGLSKQEAVKMAAELFHQINTNLFFSADAGTEIPITVSIGVATAPSDAAGDDDLMSQARNALFHAKQAGRNRYADASMVSRQAVHYLENAGIVGRKPQFDMFTGALKKFAEGQSQMLIIDGAPGMGKTSFLSTIHRNLEKTKLNTLRINGSVQESFRPYYLASNMVIKLMNIREDKGIGVLDAMDEKEVAFLSQIIPQLEAGPIQMPQNDEQYRDAIFKSFARLFINLTENRPLAVLVDDLHYCDPASLHLIRFIIKSKVIRFFLCGTASEEKQTKSQSLPLELFRTAYGRELDIRSISLTPLTVDDIGKFLNMTFPGIDMPHRLNRELVELAQGNPLFIMELLRKMISDQRIIQSGRQWKMARLEKRYFPKSLEEIVKLKMDSLDDESKRFLECAAAFGESISLSMLTGSYNEKSSKIHDFVNRGVAQGIVQSDFAENDENIRFSSKSIREAIYGAIESNHKKSLHEEIGIYHEKLYKQDLLPSASHLAYHFTRSNDSQKASAYTRLQEESDKKIFSTREAAQYASEEDGAGGETTKAGFDELGDVPLNAEGLSLAPKLFRALLVTVRNIRLYPIDSKSVISALDQLKALIEGITKDVERFSIITEKLNILINGQVVDVKEYLSISEKIVEFWDRLQLKSLTFRRGADETELKTVLATISWLEQKEITPDFWKRFIEEKNLKYIFPRQVQYTKVHKDSDLTTDDLLNLEDEMPPEMADLNFSQAKHLDESGLKIIQKIVSTLLGAHSKLKLYPDNNPVATEAINQLISELNQYFPIHPVLSLARVERSLLVNGVKVDTTGFETLARGLLRFFNDTKLNSITFMKQTSFRDLLEFITASLQAPGGDGDVPFWQNVVKDKKINGILLNQQIYSVIEEQAGTAAPGLETDETRISAADKPMEDDDLKKIPDRLRELFLTGNIQAAEAMLKQVCEKYGASDESGKKAITAVLIAALQPEDWNPGVSYIKMVSIPFFPLFLGETNTEILRLASGLIQHCAATFVLFGEYPLAAWAYGCLKKIPPEIRSHPLDSQGKGISSDKSPDVKILAPVMEDLKSQDRSRQQEAYQLLGSMGQMVIPQLIDMMKREDNLRARQLAAELVKSSGRTGIDLLKKALMGENRPDERARILDVIDTVTKNVMAELTDTLSDNRDMVRRAAFRLAERLNTPEIVQMLIECSRSSDVNLAVYAISSAAKLKPSAVRETVTQILKKSDAPELLVAACRAMGQIGDPSGIPPLVNILTRRRFLGSRKYDTQVRVAAAYALSQIPGQQSQKALNAAAKDPDYRVRETVNQAMGKKEGKGS